MNAVFRFRPANDFTLDEIKENYLWFSRPTEYNDKEDSNIIGFANRNENVKESLNRVFEDFKRVGEEVSYNGICCFTRYLPIANIWKGFPGGPKGAFIEYDKDVIEKHILNNYGVGDCFKDVMYSSNPLFIKSSSNEGYDVLTKESENTSIYTSLRGYFEHDQKNMEKFFLMLFTRINIKFKKQEELRIILGKRKFNNTDPDVKGYKIQLPDNSISKIYYNANTPGDFIRKIKEVIPSRNQLIYVGE